MVLEGAVPFFGFGIEQFHGGFHKWRYPKIWDGFEWVSLVQETSIICVDDCEDMKYIEEFWVWVFIFWVCFFRSVK